MTHLLPIPCLRAASVLLALAGALPAQFGPTPVETVPVRVEMTQEQELVTGNLRARRRSQVATLESARVDEVLVREGDLVERGAVLVRLDRRRLELDLAQAEANLAQLQLGVTVAEADLAKARDDLQSYQQAEAARDGSVSGLTLRAARRDVAVGEAQVTAAERAVQRANAQVERLRVRLANTEVRAPFDARVVARSVEIGEWVAAGTAVATLVSNGPVEAWLEVPERVPYDVLARIDSLTVRVETLGRTVQARGLRVIPDVDPRSRRYYAVALLDGGTADDGPLHLAAGMTVTAGVPANGSKERSIVPSDAILRDGAGYFVYVVRDGKDREGRPTKVATPVPVEMGFAVPGGDGQDIVLTRAPGLAAGDPVIVEGNERLRPGEAVQMKAADGAPRGGGPGGAPDGPGAPGGHGGGDKEPGKQSPTGDQPKGDPPGGDQPKGGQPGGGTSPAAKTAGATSGSGTSGGGQPR